MAEKQLTKTIRIPSDFTPRMRDKLGDRIVTFIQVRTANGLDVNNRPFPVYSDSYAGSDEFKLFGKAKTRVNLRQSGDTMASLDVINHGEGFITIGFQPGSDENDKATWIQAADNGISRLFLGIADSDLQALVSAIRDEEPSFVRIDEDEQRADAEAQEQARQRREKEASSILKKALVVAVATPQTQAEQETEADRRQREFSSVIRSIFGDGN